MLIELLREGAAARPDAPLVIADAGTTSYAATLHRAEALARGLQQAGIERFGVRVDDTAALLALLCASSAIGAEACVYPSAADPAALAGRFAHDHVLTDADLGALAIEGDPLQVAPATAPVLILTTGTTGEPKGARHDWGRLVGATRGRSPLPGARWLLAYNPNQFAGIQVFLHVLATQGTLVVGASNQPRDALRAMREHQVTHVSATPTFWRFLTALIDEPAATDLDLQQITLGGEAVPAATLADLQRLFPQARVSQIYASTEFGSTVSVRDSDNGLPLSALERDESAPVQLRIVEGELQARSSVGMLGYYGQPELDDGWRPTGDLVEVRGDRVHFVGRTSEVINVGGVKVHPLPTEEIIRSVDGVELAYVYGRKNAMTGQLVMADVVARPGVDEEALEDAIREACEVLPAAAHPRRIRFVEHLEVKENKIARRQPADTNEGAT